MKKTISGLLALFLLLSMCAGCGNSNSTPDQTDAPDQTDSVDRTDQTAQAPDLTNLYFDLTGIPSDEVALELEGNTIPAELYFYWMTAICQNLEYNLSMYSMYYGMYTELINEDGSVKWDGELEGEPIAQVVREQAKSSILSYAVLENVAAAHNVSFTEEDRASMEESLNSYIEQLGGEEEFQKNLTAMGISRESFDRNSTSSYLYQHLQDLAMDPGSDLYQAPGDDDAYVDHILLMTKDSTTNEPLSDEEIEAKRTQAEDLLAQLQEAEDLEALFNQLVEEYGEDPGRASESGYLINPDTSFVQEFKDAAFALQPGEISGIVESDYGYHILLRKELGETQLTTLAGEHLDNYLDEQMAAAQDKAVFNEKLDGVDVGAFYTGYQNAMLAAYPVEDAADGSNDGNGEDAGGDSSNG